MNEVYKKSFVVVVSVLIVIFIGTMISLKWPTIEINPDLSTNAYDILLKYLFIVIVAERSIAVYNIVMYDSQKLTLRRRIKYFKTKREDFEKLDDNSKKSYVDMDPMFKARRDEHKDETVSVIYRNLMEIKTSELEVLENKTRRFSMQALLFFGIIISIAGLSILDDLLNISPDWYANAPVFQVGLLKFIDILITGALIGGGSKSFHQLLSTIQSVLDRVKEAQSN